MADFQQIWGDFERGSQELVSSVRQLPNDVQATATSRSLSPLAVIEHMARVDEMYLGMMDSNGPDKNQGRRPAPNFLFRRVVATLRKAGNVPTFGNMVPNGNPPLNESEAHWSQTRASLFGRLDRLEDDEVAFKHPIFGRMSRLDTVEILEAHLQYHQLRLPRG